MMTLTGLNEELWGLCIPNSSEQKGWKTEASNSNYPVDMMGTNLILDLVEVFVPEESNIHLHIGETCNTFDETVPLEWLAEAE